MTEILTSSAELRATRGAGSGRRTVVMTMGALHPGHVELMRSARRVVGDEGTVVVTIFVNPTQFGVGEDFERYPRALEADLATCVAAGVDSVFAPTVREVYGNDAGFRTDSITIDPGPLGEILDGAARPSHFRGMLTVVAKLMSLTVPDVALYGEKDYQQLVLIRRMAADLDFPVEVLGVPTVRESDGLAVSSRNRYLSAQERETAGALPRALQAAAGAAAEGVDAALAAGLAILDRQDLDLDYLAITDPLLGPAPASGPARILVAARVGSTRLIDNVACQLGES
jgi:pantoate--beta-alanine ligase